MHDCAVGCYQSKIAIVLSETAIADSLLSLSVSPPIPPVSSLIAEASDVRIFESGLINAVYLLLFVKHDRQIAINFSETAQSRKVESTGSFSVSNSVWSF